MSLKTNPKDLEAEALEQLIHDVNSKCASLKNATALLRGVSSTERLELLTLMAQESNVLFKKIEHAKQQVEIL